MQAKHLLRFICIGSAWWIEEIHEDSCNKRLTMY